MAGNTENKKEVVTGLDQAADRKEAEYDLVTALLTAAEFKTQEDAITEVEIKRNGVYLFTVHVHPLSDPDTRVARRKATTYMPNPQGKKLPKIEKEFNEPVFNSWVVYLATTGEDQQKIWGNQQVMQKYGLAMPAETVDVLLTVGEKRKLVDVILEISGMEDEDEEETATQEDYAGN